jgi:hypothetical protein
VFFLFFDKYNNTNTITYILPPPGELVQHPQQVQRGDREGVQLIQGQHNSEI